MTTADPTQFTPSGCLLARSPTTYPAAEVNHRCLEILVQAAHAPRPSTLPLVSHTQDLLTNLTPAALARAAHSVYLLVDMQFTNLTWWHTIKTQPTRLMGIRELQGHLPRASALQLGRATLMLAWHNLRADFRSACLMGMSPAVAEIISGFSLTELDRALERRFRHIRPRWEDRPAIWRQMLLAAQLDDPRQTRDANLHALQLLTGDLVSCSTCG